MSSRASILEEVIRPTDGNLEPAIANFMLSLKFSDDQRARFEELSETAQDGALTPQEQDDLDGFLSAETLFIILKAKARRSLPPHNQYVA